MVKRDKKFATKQKMDLPSRPNDVLVRTSTGLLQVGRAGRSWPTSRSNHSAPPIPIHIPAVPSESEAQKHMPLWEIATNQKPPKLSQ
jgi:hypothetical protein